MKPEAVSTEEAAEFGSAEAPEPAAQPPKRRRGRPRKNSEVTQAKLKRGKSMLSEATLHCQLELTRKVQAFEEQIPWEAVYSNLPAPFDESKHTDLSFMYRNFWRKYPRAVWERNFWSAMSRKLDLKDFNERSARQYSAKAAFESLIVASSERNSSSSWTQSDTLAGGTEGLLCPCIHSTRLRGSGRCGSTSRRTRSSLHLAASNAADMRAQRTQKSDSMWMSNHELADTILEDMAAFKEEQSVRRAQQWSS
ncbi:hypothetical protein P3T76_004107 [Phytophthora citrophthora]|uniref:Uncharacterized protein n=1 Tax=Phytophthora citrophthora TaxID=4793 RepID=A0AAD9LP04_9STRA|nr:hypothetical protein P3T76_004107 [Phytophthora citrophthora]